jgi:2-iminobutanoate/2-iminopropanoate deaminase
MEKKTFDPWEWGKGSNSVQAVEIKNPEGTLYCSGQVAISSEGQPSTADMRAQFLQIIENLEHLISVSGYESSGIVRLNIFTTSTTEFFTTCVDIYQEFIAKNSIQQATTLVEVKGLYANLSIELEATVIK